MQHYIYVVFSATPYKMGALIRKATGQVYNHVSISLSETYSPMYSFARRYYRTPFYGGFVCESPSRYYVKGKATSICVCSLPVSDEQYICVHERLESMLSDQDRYLYNHLSAMATLARKPIRAADAYTCIEFCVSVLHSIGVDLDPGKYHTIDDVLQILNEHVVYTGPMPTSDDVDAAYYAKKPVPHPVWFTVRDILKLFPRLSK